MKVLRVLGVVAAAAVLVLAVGSVLLYFNQSRIISYVLNNVRQDSGILIEAPSSHIELRNHLVVVLDHPRVSLPTGETVTLDRIRAILNYHSILFTDGLPIRRLVLENPEVRLPAGASALPAALAYPNPGGMRELAIDLELIARVVKRFETDGLSVSDASGQKLLDHVKVLAFRTGSEPRLWNVSVDATVASSALKGAYVGASFVAGAGSSMREDVLAEGHVWFWKVAVKDLPVGKFETSAALHGSSSFAIHQDASVDGTASLGANSLTVAGSDLNKPLDLGNPVLDASFATSPARFAVTKATLRSGQRALLVASGEFDQPASASPTVALQIGNLTTDWDDVLPMLRSIRTPPDGLKLAMQYLKSANLTITGASLKAPLDVVKGLSVKPLLSDDLTVSAQLTGAAFALPAETGFAPVSAISTQINYSRGVLSLTQGSAMSGKSSISDFKARFDLHGGWGPIPYDASLAAVADLEGLKPAIVALAKRFKPGYADRLQALSGSALIAAQGSGVFDQKRFTAPTSYKVRIAPQGSKIAIQGLPAPITVVGGAVVVTAPEIDLQKIVAETDGGEIDVNGQLRIVADQLTTHGVTVAVHQLAAHEWLALGVDPGDLSAKGLVGGQVVVTRKPGAGVTLNGKFTLGPGQVHFGFLREPVMDRVAVVTLRGRGFAISIPDSTLQGQPLNLQVSMADWRRPKLKIKAVVRKLDFRVMSFFRMPWEPPTPVYKMKLPASGRVEAASAMFGKLPLSNMKGDFTFNAGNWHVYNFSANSMKGKIHLDITGRAKDNWIHMVGKVRGIEVGQLFTLSGSHSAPPLLGHAKVDADLWADTNSDFFDTLAGSGSIRIRKGKLNRFTLLSRLLSFINLKNWLTANVPNPLEVGLPFESVTADFKGKHGVFYTDNLRMHGPVMDIVASGSVNVANSHVDMVIGMLPFKTVNWILSNIPLIGKNVAGGTKGLLAAYFHASGPVSNPSVAPAPITSVEELVKQTLGLPINILAPDTIK